VYIPTLTKELLDDPVAKDPTGILVGDPCTDDATQGLDQDLVQLIIEAYKFGFMAPDTYRTLASDECSDAFEQMFEQMTMDDDDGQMDDDQQQQDQDMRKKTRVGTRLPPKNRKLSQMLHNNAGGIGTRFPPGNYNKLQQIVRKAVTKQKQTRGIGFSQTNPVLMKCLLALYEGSFGSSLYMNAGGIDPYGVFTPWVGGGLNDPSPLSEYLSRDDVQTALHVELADVTTFSLCTDMLNYTKQYDACGFGIDPEFPDISMINFYQEIAPKLKKTWIFSGDTDAIVPMEVSFMTCIFRLYIDRFVVHFL
jgi:hypothetical protein